MIVNICNRPFDSKEIEDITIRNNKIFIETKEDFIEIRYTKEEEIQEARDFLNFKQLTKSDLMNAVNMIILVCDHFINKKEQCEPCPLKKKHGCIFDYTPIDWR